MLRASSRKLPLRDPEQRVHVLRRPALITAGFPQRSLAERTSLAVAGRPLDRYFSSQGLDQLLALPGRSGTKRVHTLDHFRDSPSGEPAASHRCAEIPGRSSGDELGQLLMLVMSYEAVVGTSPPCRE